VDRLASDWSDRGGVSRLLGDGLPGNGGSEGLMITAMLILCSTLMALWGATMMVWLFSDKPLIAISIQILNAQDPVPAVVRRAYA